MRGAQVCFFFRTIHYPERQVLHDFLFLERKDGNALVLDIYSAINNLSIKFRYSCAYTRV